MAEVTIRHRPAGGVATKGFDRQIAIFGGGDLCHADE